jgi:hypothetical protein
MLTLSLTAYKMFTKLRAENADRPRYALGGLVQEELQTAAKVLNLLSEI